MLDCRTQSVTNDGLSHSWSNDADHRWTQFRILIKTGMDIDLAAQTVGLPQLGKYEEI